ncbi:VNG_1110C family protein [Haloarchaeobius baliensis]|uniref:VNG_1110C family protein n=1 Tax=Haloarchaeobius baliensis TaxID=1670458 RepID=UPI003F882647
MPAPAQLRDSTQIVLPAGTPQELRERLADEFVLTMLEEDDTYRFVGSPVEVDRATDFLVRQGVAVA